MDFERLRDRLVSAARLAGAVGIVVFQVSVEKTVSNENLRITTVRCISGASGIVSFRRLDRPAPSPFLFFQVLVKKSDFKRNFKNHNGTVDFGRLQDRLVSAARAAGAARIFVFLSFCEKNGFERNFKNHNGTVNFGRLWGPSRFGGPILQQNKYRFRGRRVAAFCAVFLFRRNYAKLIFDILRPNCFKNYSMERLSRTRPSHRAHNT